MDILKQNNIKATFFIIGNRAEVHPEMVKRIADEGHVIGNHTWDHPDIKKVDINKLKDEVQRNDDLVSRDEFGNTHRMKAWSNRPPHQTNK